MDEQHRRYHAGKYGIMVEELAPEGSGKYSTVRQANQDEIEKMPAADRQKVYSDSLKREQVATTHTKVY